MRWRRRLSWAGKGYASAGGSCAAEGGGAGYKRDFSLLACVLRMRGLQLLGRDEVVAVVVDLAEVLREARRVGLGLVEADAAVAIGVELLPVLGAHRFTALLVEGAQLVVRELVVAVGVDLVEALEKLRQGFRLVPADHAVTVGVGLLDALHALAALSTPFGRGDRDDRRRGDAQGGEGCCGFHDLPFVRIDGRSSHLPERRWNNGPSPFVPTARGNNL